MCWRQDLKSKLSIIFRLHSRLLRYSPASTASCWCVIRSLSWRLCFKWPETCHFRVRICKRAKSFTTDVVSFTDGKLQDLDQIVREKTWWNKSTSRVRFAYESNQLAAELGRVGYSHVFWLSGLLSTCCYLHMPHQQWQFVLYLSSQGCLAVTWRSFLSLLSCFRCWIELYSIIVDSHSQTRRIQRQAFHQLRATARSADNTPRETRSISSVDKTQYSRIACVVKIYHQNGWICESPNFWDNFWDYLEVSWWELSRWWTDTI